MKEFTSALFLQIVPTNCGQRIQFFDSFSAKLNNMKVKV